MYRMCAISPSPLAGPGNSSRFFDYCANARSVPLFIYMNILRERVRHACTCPSRTMSANRFRLCSISATCAIANTCRGQLRDFERCGAAKADIPGVARPTVLHQDVKRYLYQYVMRRAGSVPNSGGTAAYSPQSPKQNVSAGHCRHPFRGMNIIDFYPGMLYYTGKRFTIHHEHVS